jgi:drug/metabolite transporter (DMT)-like permease
VNPLALAFILASVACQVGGQIFFKLAMNRTHGANAWPRALPMLAAGIGVMTLGFLLWLGLMSKFQLSFLFPFEGVERVLLVAAAAVFLREKITPRLGAGVLLICIGIALVSAS